MKSLDEVESLLKKPAKEIFNGDADRVMKDILLVCHPDRWVAKPKDDADRAAALLKLANEKKASVDAKHSKPAEVVKSKKGEYVLHEIIAVGDVADVYQASSDGKEFVAKVSRIPGGDKILEREKAVLDKLFKASKMDAFSRYLPTLVESFPIKDAIAKRVNVFTPSVGLVGVEEVHAKRPVVEPKHLAWMFNRMLEILAFAHNQGVVHGAFVPCHLLINPANHGLVVIGWGQSVDVGGVIKSAPAKYIGWYPPEVKAKKPVGPGTDLWLACQTLIYLAGGDPATKRMPITVPKGFSSFIQGCMLDGLSMRPSDLWSLQDDYRKMLLDVLGPQKFHEFTV
jgi:serine/threonine protein kinase